MTGRARWGAHRGTPRVSLAAGHPRATRRPSSFTARAHPYPELSQRLSHSPLSRSASSSTSRRQERIKQSHRQSKNSRPPPHGFQIHHTQSLSTSLAPSTAPQTRAPIIISPGIAELVAASSSSTRTRPHRGTSSSGHRFHHPTAQIDCKQHPEAEALHVPPRSLTFHAGSSALPPVGATSTPPAMLGLPSPCTPPVVW